MSRIAILSTAHVHTKSFIENMLKATDGRKVACIWDDIPSRAEPFAAMAGAPFVANLDQVLADPTVDGFIICAENTRHLPLLRKVMPVGKPVFCEKPLVTNPADLAELRALIAANPTVLFGGYFQPFMAPMQTVAEVIRSGVLGTITRIRYRNAHHAAYARWFDNPDVQWFHNPELSGGGAFMDMGTHALHLVRTLFGPVKETFAIIENHSAQYPTCDDFGIAHLRFANGILGTIEAGWTQTGGIGGLEVVGSKKTLWNTADGYVVGGPGEKPEPVAPAPANRPNRVDRLVAILRGEIPAEELRADLEASLDAVALMTACYASAKNGAWTKV